MVKCECALHCIVCKQPVYTLLHPRHVEIIILVFTFTIAINVNVDKSEGMCISAASVRCAPRCVPSITHTTIRLYLKQDSYTGQRETPMIIAMGKTAPLWLLEDQIKSGRILGQIVAPKSQ